MATATIPYQSPRQIWDTIIDRTRFLHKHGRLRMGVTAIIRAIRECPGKAILYQTEGESPLSFAQIRPSVALATGSLTHALNEIYYECDPHTSVEHLLEIARQRMTEDYYASEERTAFYKAHQDEIDAQALKYFRQFKNWAKQNPTPWRRELILHTGMRTRRYGFVMGIIDRIDRFEQPDGTYNYRIMDYKTTKSVPNAQSDRYAQYHTQVGGGYPWLLNYVNPVEFPLSSFLTPQILYLRSASWVSQSVPHTMAHIEDFSGMVQTMARILIELARGKIPSAVKGKACHSCLADSYCPLRIGR